MRRLSLIVLTLLLLVSIAGCTGDSTSQSSKPNGSDNTSIVATNAENNETPGKAKTSSSEQGAEVIVKSNNQTSSKDKEAVLNEINNELDTMIDTINEMEDISDEDLNI